MLLQTGWSSQVKLLQSVTTTIKELTTSKKYTYPSSLKIKFQPALPNPSQTD